jgi:hypothetical protein
MNQKEIILKYLNDKRNWVFNYKLSGLQTRYGWLGSQADRRARELCGSEGDKPRFEYEGEYRGIRYLIKGRLISRCRQYCVDILGEAAGPEPVVEIKVKQEALFAFKKRY